jgi:hypothetical protein
MTIASGIMTVVSYAKQADATTIADVGDGKQLRRVECTLDLTKDTYESQEKAQHTQVQDMRHGVKRVQGGLNGELAPGAYADFFGSLVRMDFDEGIDSTALTNVTAAAGPPGTFTRAAGSWITDGFKKGDIVRWSGWASPATANNSRNYRITNLTATVMTVGTAATGAVGMPEAVVAKAAGDSVTCTVVGGKAFVPMTGHTSDAYTFEKWFQDIAQSERFIGVRIGSVRLSLPATGMATVSFGLIGTNTAEGTAEYFTAPTALNEAGLTAAVNGFLRVGGADVALVTGMELSVELGIGGEPVVGSNTIPALFYGRTRITGSLTAFFEDATLRDLFRDETEAAIEVVLTTNNTVTADFISFVMPRVKAGGASKNDSDQGVIQTIPFTALLNTAGGSTVATEKTTLSIQDSTLTFP